METSSWQTELSTVRERNKYALNKSFFCDVEFSVVDTNGNRVTLQAHKYVLAISSPVFEAMFYGDLAETGRTIDLPDCTKEGLQELLRYVYSDEVNVTGSNAIEVLYLAKKYMLPFLEQECGEYLEKLLKPEDVFIVLPPFKQRGDENLEQRCWEVVDSETERAVSSEPFLGISREVLCEFLGRDGLRIQEVKLFRAVDKWVLKRIEEKGLENNGGNKRAIIGDGAIRLIRFPLMLQKEFAGIVLPSGVLKMDEVTELVQIFNYLPPSTKLFNARRRSSLTIIPQIIFSTISSPGWNCSGSCVDAIDFVVNKAISLVGVRMFGSPGNRYDVDLTIKPQSGRVVSQISSSFPTEDEMIDDLYYGFSVTLDKPVHLQPDMRYTIAAVIQGPLSSSGNDGLSRIECKDVLIRYKSSTKSVNGTNVHRGQFTTIILTETLQ